jgi:hypothetical protein
MLLAGMLLTCGCQIRYTESQVARQHGYAASERVPAAERGWNAACWSDARHRTTLACRCYEHGTAGVRCFDLNTETDVSYEVVP